MIRFKYIVEPIAYFLVFLLILFSVSQLFVPKNNKKADGIEEQYANGILSERENSIDVLILGDSESYSAFVPMQIWETYGITSYCCGTSAQTLNNSERYLLKCFEKHSPKVVVLETNAIFREFSLAQALIRKADRYFPIFYYHDRWKNLNFNDFLLKTNYNYVNHLKGYRYSVAVNGVSPEGYMKPDKTIKEITAINREYINNFKVKCDNKGATLILVSTPSTENWNMAKHNGVAQLAEELGIEYIDMNLMSEEIPIDWSKDTRDKGDHLNYSGATKVTKYIGNYLWKKGFFIDHRTDPIYSDWNKSLDEFKKIVNAN